jgi:diguanylate cyclase (GGDEF)-like protein
MTQPSIAAVPLAQISILADALICVSFLSLSVTMLILWKRSRKRLPHPATIVTFGLFAFACAFSHALQILVWLQPLHWMLHLVELLTAMLAISSIYFVPRMVRWFITLFAYANGSRSNEARFKATAEASMDALFLLDAVRNAVGEIEDFRFTFLNQKAQHLLNLPSESILGARLCELMPMHRTEGFFNQFKQVALTGVPSVTEFSVKDEQINASWLRYSVVKMEDGIAIVASNLTEQREAEYRIRRMAQLDRLTGLPNRSLLDDRIHQAIERAIRYRHNAAVLMLDLDNFRQLNKVHGMAAGDEVLRTIAARLRKTVRATDSVFRLGADEFVIVLGDLASKGPAVDFARKIFVSLMPPIPWQQEILNVSASIGVANYPDDGATPEALLVQADIAMCRMKRNHSSPPDIDAVRIA